MIYYILGVIGQWVSLFALSVGIGIEIKYEADFGFMAITVGAILFAVATKIKVIGKEKAVKRVKELEEQLEKLNTG